MIAQTQEIPRNGYTVEEFAQRYRISAMCIYRQIKSGKLKAIKVAPGSRRGLRITPEGEAAWLAAIAYKEGDIAAYPRRQAEGRAAA